MGVARDNLGARGVREDVIDHRPCDPETGAVNTAALEFRKEVFLRDSPLPHRLVATSEHVVGAELTSPRLVAPLAERDHSQKSVVDGNEISKGDAPGFRAPPGAQDAVAIRDQAARAPITPPTPLFNGDFELIPLPQYAGWTYHGGLPLAPIIPENPLDPFNYIVQLVGPTVIRHNRFFIPENAQTLSFDYRVASFDEFFQDEMLIVTLRDMHGVDVAQLSIGLPAGITDWITRTLALSSVPRGAYTLTFELAYGLTPKATVGLDNIRLVLVGSDDDGDGIPDAGDPCQQSDISETVVIDGCDSGAANITFSTGCTMVDLIAECAMNACNHGTFVSCVARASNDWKNMGLISGQEHGAIVSCAAQADVPTEACDLDGNGAVNGIDLLILISAWGSNPQGPPDFDGDGIVGVPDFLELLANWGPLS